MPAGTVRPRASQVPGLGAGVVAEYLEAGWQITAGGRVESGSRVGPCARRREPCVRYGPTGGPLCAICQHPGGRLPVPARITLALDTRQLYGPEVDEACGVEEPAVDEWEAGTRIPTVAQVAALAQLTGMPVEYFYLAVEVPGQVFICDRSKRKHGLTVVESRVDEHGVLHRQFHGGPP